MTIETDVHELLDRTRRLETRMVQLGDYVGANLRSKQRIEIAPNDHGDDVIVLIDSLDVSVSRILTELRQANAHQSQVSVYLGKTLAFTLYPNALRTS